MEYGDEVATKVKGLVEDSPIQVLRPLHKKRQVLPQLRRTKDDPEFVKSLGDWHKKNAEAMALFVCNIDPDLLDEIHVDDTTKAIWDHLRNQFGERGFTLRHTLFIHLMTSKLSDFNALQDFQIDFKSTLSKLHENGEPLPKDLQIAAFLHGVEGHLEESCWKKYPEKAPNRNKSNESPTEKDEDSGKRKDGKPFAGSAVIVHPEINMTAIGTDDSSALESSATSPMALFAHKNSWYFDTGATNHLCNARHAFTSYTEFTIPQAIEGIGGCISSLGKGTYLSVIHSYSNKNKDGSSPELGKDNIVRASRPETILPPESWIAKSNEKSNEMQDHQPQILECKYTVWEVADTLWEL
ncbi:hypothetical protein MMC31_002215 [Peltigera leucophlebia]|nr:hypothetical protein [Peltigera leucophlebia]